MERHVHGPLPHDQLRQDDGREDGRRHVAQGAPQQVRRLDAAEQRDEREPGGERQEPREGEHRDPAHEEALSAARPTTMPVTAAAMRPSL